jgi:hypothetical protein
MGALPVYSPTEGGITPVPTAFTAADTIPVSTTGIYLLIARNTTASQLTVKVDDPTFIPPPGSAGMDPDVSVIVPITTGERVIKIRASRCRDVNGNVNLANTNPAAGTTGYVLGPYPE